MFSNIAAFVALAMPLLAVATPTNVQRNAGSCNTGAIQCCNSVQSSSSPSPSLATLFDLLGIDASSITGDVGLDCSPVTVVGAASGSCTASPVCCENNSFGSLISLGCVPITL